MLTSPRLGAPVTGVGPSRPSPGPCSTQGVSGLGLGRRGADGMSGFICAVLDSAGFLPGADMCCAGNFQLFAQRALTSVPRGSRGRDWERRQRSDFQAGTFSALTPGLMTWRGGALPAGPQPAAPRTGRWRRSP